MKRKHTPLIVISGAIGSGKGTVLHALVHEIDVHWVATHTTRPMRREDPTLSRRIFDTETTFARHEARNEFIETIELTGYRYGLLKHDLESALRTSRGVIVELTAEGGMKLAKLYPEAFLIFLASDEKHRRERITHRQLDEPIICERMQDAKQEEKLALKHYDYVVENVEDNPNDAIDEIKKLIFEQFPELKEKTD